MELGRCNISESPAGFKRLLIVRVESYLWSFSHANYWASLSGIGSSQVSLDGIYCFTSFSCDWFILYHDLELQWLCFYTPQDSKRSFNWKHFFTQVHSLYFLGFVVFW